MSDEPVVDPVLRAADAGHDGWDEPLDGPEPSEFEHAEHLGPAGELPDDTQPTTGRRRRKMNPIVEWLIVVAVAITSALLVRAFVVQQFAVEGESMMSTLHNGDRVLVNRLSYRLHDPRRGDVVVLKRFSSPSNERDLIKRVIALPGETIEYRSCTAYINGLALKEPYLDAAIQAVDGCGPDQPKTTVPAGEVFVMGDHRGRSQDSRTFGPVPYDLLIGRAFVIIWPFGHWGWL